MVDVMITGLGGTGGAALEILARMPDVGDIVVCDAKDQGKKIATAVSGANHLGFYPRVTFERVDLMDTERAAAVIAVAAPVVILNCTALMPWYGRKLLDLPADVEAAMKSSGVAGWLPTHVCIAQKVMLAVRRSGVNTRVINLSFPDAVNAILHRQNLGPVMGAGNADLLIPNLQREVARQMKGHERDVQVLLVAHHALTGLQSTDTPESMPYHIQVLHKGVDITDDVSIGDLLYRASQDRLPGTLMDLLVASSLVKNAMAIVRDSHLLTFAPGPCGLIGGYSVKISRDCVEVNLPDGITMQEAIALNERAQERDGISEILEDGTVVLTEKAWRGMKEATGYDMEAFHPEDACRRAKELIELFHGLRSKYGMKGYEV